MASSEIEVVSESRSQNDSSRQNGNPDSDFESSIVDVYSASAYGQLDKVRKYVEEDAPCLKGPNGNGYYAVQWAALNGFLDVLQYIIEHGADVNATDRSGQTVLHWAAVRGSVSAADVLLQNGARLEAADGNGYRTVHVAAQYGQTVFLYHVITKYNAEFDAPDSSGRSPLHWSGRIGIQTQTHHARGSRRRPSSLVFPSSPRFPSSSPLLLRPQHIRNQEAEV